MTDQNSPTLALVFAADLGGTHLRGALIDERGNIHVQQKQETPKGSSPNCIVNSLMRMAEECERLCPGARISTASIVVPGTVSKANDVVVQAPNLPSLNNFALKSALEESLGSPVLLENDANAAAVGEMWLGAARGAKNIICVTLGTGVGGGIILDGKLWRGTEGSAGELGHSSVDPFNGPDCKCGNRGCLEMFASATAIVRMTRESLKEFPDSVLIDQCLSAARIFEAGKQGDKLALQIFEKVGVYLGVGLANLINSLGPEVVVIGGGVANGWTLFESALREEVAKRAFSSLMINVQIKPAECGDNAGLVGAAHLAWSSPELQPNMADCGECS